MPTYMHLAENMQFVIGDLVVDQIGEKGDTADKGNHAGRRDHRPAIGLRPGPPLLPDGGIHHPNGARCWRTGFRPPADSL